MAQNTLKTSTAILWTAAYFGIMVLYTFLDIAAKQSIIMNMYHKYILIYNILQFFYNYYCSQFFGILCRLYIIK